MTKVNPEFIERYQILYDKDPQSKVFAPLAEAYRKMGLINKAYTLSLEGVKKHPHFAGGRIALAQALLDLEEPQKAAIELEKAVELAPENILAYNLLGDTFLQLKKTKEALKAFKMLLFLNPHHKKAQGAVQKLESLTADEFSEESFQIPASLFEEKLWPPKNENSNPAKKTPASQEKIRSFSNLERYLSLIDAYIVRNDIEKASATLDEALFQFGEVDSLKKRKQLIYPNQIEHKSPPPNKEEEKKQLLLQREKQKNARRVKTLQHWLYLIEKNRKTSANSVEF